MINKGAEGGGANNYLYWEPEYLHKLAGRCTKNPPVFDAGYVSALSAYYDETPNEDMLPGHADALRVFRGEQKMTSPTVLPPVAVVAVQGVDGEQADGAGAPAGGGTDKDRSLRPLSAVGARARAQPPRQSKTTS